MVISVRIPLYDIFIDAGMTMFIVRVYNETSPDWFKNLWNMVGGNEVVSTSINKITGIDIECFGNSQYGGWDFKFNSEQEYMMFLLKWV